MDTCIKISGFFDSLNLKNQYDRDRKSKMEKFVEYADLNGYEPKDDMGINWENREFGHILVLGWGYSEILVQLNWFGEMTYYWRLEMFNIRKILKKTPLFIKIR